jgi:hypothetical protein
MRNNRTPLQSLQELVQHIRVHPNDILTKLPMELPGYESQAITMKYVVALLAASSHSSEDEATRVGC